MLGGFSALSLSVDSASVDLSHCWFVDLSLHRTRDKTGNDVQFASARPGHIQEDRVAVCFRKLGLFYIWMVKKCPFWLSKNPRFLKISVCSLMQGRESLGSGRYLKRLSGSGWHLMADQGGSGRTSEEEGTESRALSPTVQPCLMWLLDLSPLHAAPHLAAFPQPSQSPTVDETRSKSAPEQGQSACPLGPHAGGIQMAILSSLTWE